MIASSRGAAYRRFYLYAALSVSVIALAVAAMLLLRQGLQLVGFGVRPIPADVSRAVALSVALIAFSIPVGGAHLWLILRSLADPAERENGVRHQFLNLWVAFALLAELIAGITLMNTATSDTQPDVTGQAAAMTVVAVIGAVAAWWIRRTPPASSQHRVRAGVAVMLISMAVAAFSLGSAAGAAGGLFAFPYASPQFYPRGYDPTSFLQQMLRSAYPTAGLALAIWSVGFAWQRPFEKTRDRLGYALAGYGIGTLVLLVGAAYGIAGAIRFARDPAQAEAFTGAWSEIAAGVLLVTVHATLLLRDRGRNGHPAVTTTRLLLAFPALVGLGCVVGGLGLGWHAIVEREVVPAQHFADDLTLAAALMGVGLIAYVPSWLAFDARTAADSAVRRFYLFTVVCLALIGGLVSGVLVLYNAITSIAGVGGEDAGRIALTWIAPALSLAAIFAVHLTLLLRDQRLTRAGEPAPADGLLALLEDVRSGRVSVERAAATIRGSSP
ncbi:MAG: hypothetical protein M3P16_03965 [Chloroflexota bacterium]|nr:hypothetical protein [Chloroflexota bacterium]